MAFNIFTQMKYFFAIMFSAFFYNSLLSQENVNDLMIEYVAISRGTYEKIELRKNSFINIKGRKDANRDTLQFNDERWKEIVALVNKINLNELPYLIAPSKKRLYDGAAHAQLKIVFKDKIYESSGFDHGNPPNEIKSLIMYVLEIDKDGKD